LEALTGFFTFERLPMTTFTQDDVLAFLSGRHAISKRYQEGRGVDFQITVSEFVALFNTYRRNAILGIMRKSGVAGLNKIMRHKEKGWVLTWTSGKAQPVMTAAIVSIMTRKVSKRNAQFKKGDRHSEKSKAAISKKKKGVAQAPDHSAAISVANKGRVFTEEHKANLRTKALLREARKRGELVQDVPVAVSASEAPLAPVQTLQAIVEPVAPIAATPKRQAHSPESVIAALKERASKRPPSQIEQVIHDLRSFDPDAAFIARLHRIGALATGVQG
jgi:hypothetical protein